MSQRDDDTVDLEFARRFADQFFVADQPQVNVRVGAATHQGCLRERNEDHYAVIRRTRRSEMLLTNLPEANTSFPDDEAYCLLVADGIGGAAFGQFASELALRTTLELSSRASSWLMKFSHLDVQQMRERVKAYIEHLQEAFRRCADVNPDMRGMGTTMTAAYVMPSHVLISHIGDSRAYLFREGEIDQLTRDQTMAQEMIDAGMAPDKVERFTNMLTNSLSATSEEIEAEITHLRLHAGDRLLLCTDGLSDLVSDSAIADALSSAEDAQAVCDTLVALALDAGGRDNVTVTLADILPD